MKTTLFKYLLTIVSSITLLMIMSCEGPEGPTGPQGPQGEIGMEGPQGPAGKDGEDGNANVIRYVFDGHNFRTDAFHRLSFQDLTVDEFEQSLFIVFLIVQFEDGISNNAYPIPGLGQGGASLYRLFIGSFENNLKFIQLFLEEGPGEDYDSIVVFRIPSSSTIDMAKKDTSYDLPSNIETADYNAVMNYFGDNIKTIRK